WILLLPLETPPLRWGLEASERCVLAQRSALLQRVGVLLCVLLFRCGYRGGFLAPLLAAIAAM
ncbi:MAG: hypothetical protein ACI4L8_00835, partial [Candidatus Fimadaptatus sp.]